MNDRCVYVSVVTFVSSLCTVDVSGGGRTVVDVGGGGVAVVNVSGGGTTVVEVSSDVVAMLVSGGGEVSVDAVVTSDADEAVVVLTNEDDEVVVVLASDEIVVFVVAGVAEVEVAVPVEVVGVTIVERPVVVVDPALRDEKSVVVVELPSVLLLACMRAISAPPFGTGPVEEPVNGHMHAAGPEKAPRAAITAIRGFTMFSLLHR